MGVNRIQGEAKQGNWNYKFIKVHQCPESGNQRQSSTFNLRTSTRMLWWLNTTHTYNVNLAGNLIGNYSQTQIFPPSLNVLTSTKLSSPLIEFSPTFANNLSARSAYAQVMGEKTMMMGIYRILLASFVPRFSRSEIIFGKSLTVNFMAYFHFIISLFWLYIYFLEESRARVSRGLWSTLSRLSSISPRWFMPWSIFEGFIDEKLFPHCQERSYKLNSTTQSV